MARFVQQNGSSPRGRGTRSRPISGTPTRRFIPAWAGNTAAQRLQETRSSVHPRVGGEHPSLVEVPLDLCGSSPRGRGTLPWSLRRPDPQRFIPAWAGNTYPIPLSKLAVPVHPRVGGEHWRIPESRTCRAGSSPRGRGTPVSTLPASIPERFIPAWAGNTVATSDRHTSRPVHPRVGGEHAY